MIDISKNIELLAPAGDMESLYAAVNNGCDAVYMGGSKFSARAFAKNFTVENIKEAVDYCHSYGVKVYITINTLIKEKEMKEVIEYIGELYNIGVDAVITQDLGLANVVIGNFEDLEVHASTQMSVHNKAASLLLDNMGFKRIVLARELSLGEIKEISEEVETEIFIHGALCVCYSGMCLMSSMIGGRSGNRGRCAQPCRLPYDIIDKASGETKRGYLLSPKDICTSQYIGKIIDSGTSSLKIEGRMKRPEYVAGVVGSYRKIIDSHLCGREPKDVTGEEKKLLQLFNREGFSRGYFFGSEGRDMMAYNNPKNAGIIVGRAIDNNLVELTDNLSVKDGIRIGDEGAIVSRLLKEGKDVEKASSGERVKILPGIYRKGDVVYKTTDHRLNEELSLTYSNKYGRKISISLNVSFLPGEPIRLKAGFRGREYEYIGAAVEEPLNKPLSREFVEEKLRKSGNTPFEIQEVVFDVFGDGYLSAASLNEARRNLLSRLLSIDIQRKPLNLDKLEQEYKKKRSLVSTEKDREQIPDKLFVVTGSDQLKALEDLGVEAAAVDIFSRYMDKEKALKSSIPNIFLKLPNVARKEYGSIIKFVEDNIDRIRGIITANLGFLEYFKNKTICIGDYKLNIFNSETLQLISKYCGAAALSVELNKMEIKDIMSNVPKGYPAQVLAYGKVELMISEYCAVGSVIGGKSREKHCTAHCEGNYTLKDRKGMEFAIRNDNFCRSHIYNAVPINLLPMDDELKKLGIGYMRYDFIDESYEEVYKVVEAVIKNKNIDIEDYTRGHYKRGVD
ncbi:MAG: DUF3656 domain-containing protein [Bacillota bacterium]|nr:DUF3656 domain-containing protein [Bacillota bacterium]